jgi:hypothetical protein
VSGLSHSPLSESCVSSGEMSNHDVVISRTTN